MITWATEHVWPLWTIVLSLLLLRAWFLVGLGRTRVLALKRGLWRAEHGFNQIERCGPSSDPASSQDAQQLAKLYALEIKAEVDRL